MAFSRIRKGLAGGDFDRSANQQRTLRGIHARIRSQADRPGFIERGVMTVMEHTGHQAWGPRSSTELAQAVAQVEPGAGSPTCVVRGRIGFVGAASVVFPDVAQARRLGDAARRRRHPARLLTRDRGSARVDVPVGQGQVDRRRPAGRA